MRLQDAQDSADRLNRDPQLTARVVRILPERIDPVQDDDNGWDVEITITEERTG